MTSFAETENKKVEISYFQWLGYKNVNGALQKEGFDGEIQFYDGNFWYCKDNKAVKKLEIQRDFNTIYLNSKSKSIELTKEDEENGRAIKIYFEAKGKSLHDFLIWFRTLDK